ncbi:hypothetical protein [Actinophytocola sp. KF-1]
MILVETLEDLVHSYLKNPGSAVGRVNVQDLVGRLADHLLVRGVAIGFVDGSRLTFPGTTPDPPEPQRHHLPLVLQEDSDGHIRIHCDGRDCFWFWPLHTNATPQAKGDAIAGAVEHALRRRVHN